MDLGARGEIIPHVQSAVGEERKNGTVHVLIRNTEENRASEMISKLKRVMNHPMKVNIFYSIMFISCVLAKHWTNGTLNVGPRTRTIGQIVPGTRDHYTWAQDH